MNDVKNLTDRELLIQHGVVLNKLCGSITDSRKENADEHKLIFEKIDSLGVAKVSNRLFYSTVSIIVGILILLTSAVGLLNIKVSTNTSDIEHVEHKLNRTNK